MWDTVAHVCPVILLYENNGLDYEDRGNAFHLIVVFIVRSSEIVTKESRINSIYSFGVAGKQYWKKILVVDDDADSLASFKFGIENATKSSSRRIVVDAHYDLLLTDINMPYIDEFQLSERILVLWFFRGEVGFRTLVT
jgi:hypothetical protein